MKACDFIGMLFLARDVAHSVHLNTRSFSKHMALNTFYDEIIELADRWAEAYQGCYEVIKAYPKDFHLATDPVKYLTSVKAFVKDIRTELPKDSELQNICDEIADLIDSTLYKLKAFK